MPAFLITLISAMPELAPLVLLLFFFAILYYIQYKMSSRYQDNLTSQHNKAIVVMQLNCDSLVKESRQMCKESKEESRQNYEKMLELLSKVKQD